jgi:four helix bundle protein
MGNPLNHRKLVAWQEAVNLVELIYRETSTFPRDETFGLTAQMRRSAVSISSNIAEGAGRNSSGELIQFLGIASGSRAELDTQLEIAVRLGFIRENSEAFPQLDRVGKLLVGLRRSLKQRSLRDQT